VEREDVDRLLAEELLLEEEDRLLAEELTEDELRLELDELLVGVLMDELRLELDELLVGVLTDELLLELGELLAGVLMDELRLELDELLVGVLMDELRLEVEVEERRTVGVEVLEELLEVETRFGEEEDFEMEVREGAVAERPLGLVCVGEEGYLWGFDRIEFLF